MTYRKADAYRNFRRKRWQSVMEGTENEPVAPKCYQDPSDDPELCAPIDFEAAERGEDIFPEEPETPATPVRERKEVDVAYVEQLSEEIAERVASIVARAKQLDVECSEEDVLCDTSVYLFTSHELVNQMLGVVSTLTSIERELADADTPAPVKATPATIEKVMDADYYCTPGGDEQELIDADAAAFAAILTPDETVVYDTSDILG